jgi:hypothetical protein
MAAALRDDHVVGAPGPPTVPNAILSPTQVLASPTARHPTDSSGTASGSEISDHQREGVRRRAWAIVTVALVAVFVVVVALGTRSGGPPSTPSAGTSPTSPPTPADGSLPEPLDRAIRSLEEAVQP